MTEQTNSPFDEIREKYFEILKPLFLPEDPVGRDIVNYFGSLLRALGQEDTGLDPYVESRATLEDLNSFFKISLPEDRFPDPYATHMRIGLLLYSHIVEMDAPYEVLTNLLRFRLGKGYSPGAFIDFLTKKEEKSFWKRGLDTGRKIEIIKKLSDEAGLPDVGAIFNDFYYNHLRNAVGHSDFVLADNEFRCRGNLSGTKAFRIPYEKLDEIICAAKAFIAAFFQVDLITRQVWGLRKNQAMPYDPHYKGLMEILVDNRDVMCGFRVHWPNGSDSTYRRTENGTEMVNCYLDMKGKTIELFVGLYAREASEFSPLVERDAEPIYSFLEGSDVSPTWPADA